MTPPLRTWAQQQESRGNRQGQGDWRLYAAHRALCTETITKLARTPAARLCLLGAGNANDVDLAFLAGRFAEIHLVDIDPAALARASERQTAEVRARLHTHAPIDLSGLYARLERHRERSRARLDPARWVDEATQRVLGGLPSDFDVVASCCVLSQMAWSLGALLGEGTPAVVAMEQMLVAIHLRTIVALTRPGATSLLVADAASSDTYPVDSLDRDALADALATLADQGILFRVSNPTNLRRSVRRDPYLSRECASAQLGAPWLWTGPGGLVYLVFAMTLTRQIVGTDAIPAGPRAARPGSNE